MAQSWAFDFLDGNARTECMHEAARKYPLAEIKPLQSELQGRCSYTLEIIDHHSTDKTSARLLQFRPTNYALDINLGSTAKTNHGHHVPSIELVSTFDVAGYGIVHLYDIEVIEGVPFSKVLSRSAILRPTDFANQARYVTDLAAFFAQSWHCSRSLTIKPQCWGKVGSCLNAKLAHLTVALPTAVLRQHAAVLYRKRHVLECLPIVLCHGDLIPANIIVGQKVPKIQGFVDWAEAEYLPFGLPLYGLEFFLGYEQLETGEFIFYDGSVELRKLFWSRLEDNVEELRANQQLATAVAVARDIGVLLWYGYAWDNGAIDRVVDPTKDALELRLLETFLAIPSHEIYTSASQLSRQLLDNGVPPICEAC